MQQQQQQLWQQQQLQQQQRHFFRTLSKRDLKLWKNLGGNLAKYSHIFIARKEL
jgi:hypothetical protein